MKFKIGDKVRIKDILIQNGRLLKDCIGIIGSITNNKDYFFVSVYEGTTFISNVEIHRDYIELVYKCQNSQDNQHNWKYYEGFTEKYEYCELCDEKRSV